MPLPRPALHPNLSDLAFLLGTWRGQGEGHYPTIASFGYEEEVCFSHVGKPFLIYSQRTWALDDRRGLHSETGYWRAPAPGRVELVLAHPTGVTEIEEGTVERTVGGGHLALDSRLVGLSGSAKKVDRLARSITVEGDVLTYRLSMAAVDQPFQVHLEATLRRQPEGP